MIPPVKITPRRFAPLNAWGPVRDRGYSPLLQVEARRLAAGITVMPRVRDSLVLRSVLDGAADRFRLQVAENSEDARGAR